MLFFSFIKWRSAQAYQFYSLSQGQSTVAQQAEMTVAEHSWQVVCELFLPDRGFHTMSRWHIQPTPTLFGWGVCLFRCNLPPAILAEGSGSFTCHCSNMGTLNKSRHRNLTLEKKILPLLLWASEQGQVCNSEKGRGGGGRSDIQVSITTDHTNGCLEAAIKCGSCLCVGMGASCAKL